jgi:putative membrane protein
MRRFTAKTLVPFAALVMFAVLTALRPSATPPAGAVLDDPTIVAIFDAANTYDIETGLLAAEKGNSRAVREFGEMLARDHRNVRAQGRDLAAALKVTPTPPQGEFALTVAHEVDFHSAVIEAVTKTLLPALQNAQVKDLVTKVAPAFAAHRDAAQSLLDKQKR